MPQVVHDRVTSVAVVEDRQLPLYVDGFDAEQIWLQLESMVPPLRRRAQRLSKHISPDAKLLDTDTEQDLDGKAGVLGKAGYCYSSASACACGATFTD